MAMCKRRIGRDPGLDVGYNGRDTLPSAGNPYSAERLLTSRQRYEAGLVRALLALGALLIAVVVAALLTGCAGQVAPEAEAPATCAQVGSSFVWGKGSVLRYECDRDPGEGCAANTAGEFECPSALVQAVLVCP